MVVPMEQWASQPFQDKSADLWVVMLFDHNEKYSDRMERFYKAFAVTFELRFPFPLMATSPMTFTLDFQGQILKKSYLRNGMADWHGTKGMWVDRMLHLLCDFQCPPHPWPWPWIFKVKFWKCCISGMEWPIDMERKRCESIGCYTHFVTFNIPLTHDLDLGFSRSNFEKVISQEWDGRFTWN